MALHQQGPLLNCHFAETITAVKCLYASLAAPRPETRVRMTLRGILATHDDAVVELNYDGE